MGTRRIFSLLLSIMGLALSFQQGMANGLGGSITKGDLAPPISYHTADNPMPMTSYDLSFTFEPQQASQDEMRPQVVMQVNPRLKMFITAFARGCLGEGTAGFMSAEDYCAALSRILAVKPGDLLDLQENEQADELRFFVFDEQSQDVVIKVLSN